jgi:DNA gyrase inhibitor GyrI
MPADDGIPAGFIGELLSQGAIHKIYRAWKLLFDRWLPRNGLEPTHVPLVDVF